MKQKKKSFFSNWKIAWFFSLSIHIFLILIMYFFLLSPKLTPIPSFPTSILAENKDYFLIDLVNPKNQETEEKRVISLYNYQGLGRLVKRNEEQHIVGKFNPEANRTTFTLSEFAPLQEKKNSKNSLEKKSETKGSLAKIKENKEKNNLARASKEYPATPATNPRALGNITKNSLAESFWYDESEQLQVASLYYPGSEFFLELRKNINEKFRLYVHSGGVLNYYYTKTDQITALASVDQEGVVKIEELHVIKPTQSYLSYLAKSVGSSQVPQEKLPPKFLLSEEDKMFFYLNIKFNERPIRGWEYRLKFTKDFF